MASARKRRTQGSAQAKRARPQKQELDSTYLLKLIMYLILGALWVRVANVAGTTQIPIPVGLVLGIIFASHEHFSIDRKIEYAVLLVAMFVGLWIQSGLYITY
jgi:hypothetical protein